MKFNKVFIILLIGMISLTGFATNDLNQNSLVKNKVKGKNMLNIDWNVKIKTDSKTRKLAILSECEIIDAVDNLTTIATIMLPETVMNDSLNFENKIKRGSYITIDLGYNDELRNEFTGYVREVTNNGGSIKIECEGALFLFRKGVKDIVLENTTVKDIGKYIVKEIDNSYTVECDYDLRYDEFVIHQASGYDVLKKIKEETKANVFFNEKDKVLHIHRPYTHKGGEVRYSFQKNIENSSLEFESRLDKKVQVTVESVDKKGNMQKYTTGTAGGDKVTIKAGTMSKKSIELLAETTLLENSTPKYKGSFDAWLIPFVKPTYSAHIKDEDYIDKQGWYYVSSVTTSISPSGGKRTITLSKRLA